MKVLCLVHLTALQPPTSPVSLSPHSRPRDNKTALRRRRRPSDLEYVSALFQPRQGIHTKRRSTFPLPIISFRFKRTLPSPYFQGVSHYGVALQYAWAHKAITFMQNWGVIKVDCHSSTAACWAPLIFTRLTCLLNFIILKDLFPSTRTIMAVIQLMHKSDFNFQTKLKHVRVRYDLL